MRTQGRLALVIVVTFAAAGCDKKLDVFSDTGIVDRGAIDLGRAESRTDAARPDLDPSKPLKTEWIKVLGDSTTATFFPDGIETDAEGNIYLEGWLAGRLQVGSDVIGADNVDSQALIKLDSSGKPLWGRHVGPVDMRGPGTATWPPDNLGFALEPASGSSYLAGTFSGVTTAGSTTLTSAGGKDIFVAKLDKDGNWLWATRAGGPEDEYVRDAAPGFIGPVVVGDFAGTAAFGQVQLTSSGGTDIFVAHLDKSGAWIRALAAGSPQTALPGGMRSPETALAIASRDGSRMIVSGNQLAGTWFGSDKLAAGRFLAEATIQGSPAPGSWVWAGVTPGPWWDLIVDPSSATFYAAGSVWSPMPGRPMVGAFEADGGKVVWGFNAASSSHDSEAIGLALDPAGGVYAGGYFKGTLELTGDGQHTLTSAGDVNNGFVLKLDGKGRLLWAKPITAAKGSYPVPLCTGPDRVLYVAGSFAGAQADLDGQVVTGQAANVNAFVWKLAP